MRVTDYELYEVAPRWGFLKLETDTGRVGWGEVYAKWHYQGDAPATASAAAVDQLLEKYVLGEDAAEIERRWEAMYRSSFYRGGAVHMSALGAIDVALWDLKGKAYGAPVYELLGGGARDRVRLYHHAGPETAAAAVEAGFSAIKLGPDPMERIPSPERVQSFVEELEHTRDAVGDGVDIAVDFHGGVSRSAAKRLVRAIEPHDPMFVEEPVTPEFEAAFPELRASTTVPIATGERLHTRFDFKRYFEAGGVDVAQPDVAHAGGITESRRIADMAATYDVALAPHCPLGPIALAASVQVMATAPSALVQEQTLYHTDGWRRLVVDAGPLEHADGFLDLPEGPGLGVEVDEAVVADLDGEDLDYCRPIYEYADGGVADG